MSIGINTNNYSNMYQSDSSWGKSASISKSEESGYSDMYRKLEYNRWKQEKSKSVVEQSVSYADQLRALRKKTKEVSTQKKKLQYNFKKISSQIVRSKNSISARKAVQAAKREIARLKRLKGSGEYDDEELQLAIDHAKSMEKVAKKKVSHLEQEEMVERAHKGYGAALEEIEEKKQEAESNEDENAEESEELIDPSQELEIDEEYVPGYDYQYEMQIAMEEYQQQMQYEMEISMEEYQQQAQNMMNEISENAEEMADNTNQAMSDMMDEFNDQMQEMMEDMDLTELAESLYAPDPNMSEEDLKMLKIKHRTKEMKEIAEADKEYLKGMIEHEKEKAKESASGAMSGENSGSSQVVFGSSGEPDIHSMTIRISMPGAAAGGAMITTTV